MSKRLFLMVGASLLLTLPVGAQTAPTNTTGGVVKEARDSFRQELRGDIKDLREGVQSQVKDFRENLKKEVLEKKADLKDAVRDQREAFKKEVEMKREEVKKEVEAKKAEFKEKAKKIRDDKKRQLAQKLADNLSDFNQNRVDHFTAVVDKIEDVLGRVKSRTDKAASRGLDVAVVRTAITSAEGAIAAAREAIKVQAAKVYAVTLTDADANLKTDFAKVRRQLHDDLKVVDEAVKAARESVRKAAVALAQIPKVDEEEAPANTSATQPAANTSVESNNPSNQQ